MVKSSDSSSTSAVSTRQTSSSSWPWPYYCHHSPRTLSFRIPDDIFKTINSAYILDTLSSSSSSSSLSPPPPKAADVSLESVIRSARSDRIFFDPGATSSSILRETSSSRLPIQWTLPDDIPDVKNEGAEDAPSPYSNSVFLSVDSRDPVHDFRKSMEEMVAAHNLKDWDRLEELLQWYLKVNDEANHPYIYGAFLDLLVCQNLVQAAGGGGPQCGRNYSPSSPLSFDTSSTSTSLASSSTLSVRCVSGLGTEDYDKEQCSTTSSNF